MPQKQQSNEARQTGCGPPQAACSAFWQQLPLGVVVKFNEKDYIYDGLHDWTTLRLRKRRSGVMVIGDDPIYAKTNEVVIEPNARALAQLGAQDSPNTTNDL